MPSDPLLPINVSYARKTEISIDQPEDVTRAKASAWLDALSPITEWAGLKGDALRHKRDLLRLEREASLVEVVRKLKGKLEGKVISPIPTKQLVPALEKASLEKPDSEFIEKWANLLASAAQSPGDDVAICTSILGDLGPTEARLLDNSKLHLSRLGYWMPDELKKRGATWGRFMSAEYQSLEDAMADHLEGKLSQEDTIRKLTEANLRSPNAMTGFHYGSHSGDKRDFSSQVSDLEQVAIDVLKYRNLLQAETYWEIVEFKASYKRRGTLAINFVYLTNLGVTFLNRVSTPS